MKKCLLNKSAILLPVFALLLTACAKPVAQPEKPELVKNELQNLMINPTGSVALKLYVLDCGKIIARDVSVLFSPGVDKGLEVEMADSCYLIQHPSKGAFFWDAGLSDALKAMPDGMENYGLNFSVSNTLKAQLKSIGINPSEITYLAFSHLHPDHTGNASYFTQPTWLVQKVDYDIAFTDTAVKYGYNPKDYSHLKTAPVIKLNGDYDVFGDGSVVIVFTPGHSMGHQALFVDLPETGPIILSGDLYHFKKNRDNYVIPAHNVKKATIQSFAKIDNILQKTHAELWIQHDKQQFDSLKLAPLFYK